MIGQLVPAWGETWKYIWAKLLQGSDESDQLIVELFREFAAPPVPPLEPPPPPENAFDANGALVDAEALAQAAAYQGALAAYERQRARHEEALNGLGTRKTLHSLIMAAADTEQAAIQCLERGFLLAEEIGGDALANRFYLLVDAFLLKFSLRYDLRRPFTLHPTLSGVFASMMRDLKAVAQSDADCPSSEHSAQLAA
ncbi:MAG: hypothetical protein J0M19_09245 [Sphingomonadales bacterium]|nr:hypothetical protein [Sphingomonadales bacterium]